MMNATRLTPSSTAAPRSARVFDLSLGEMLWSRRTIFMALVVGGPVLLALIVLVGLELFGMRRCASTASAMTGSAIFGVMIWMLFLRFIVPVLGVFYGTALMADEVEDKTITYPVHAADSARRRAGRQVPRLPGLHDPGGAAVGDAGLLLIVPFGQPGGDVPRPDSTTWPAGALGLAVYGAVFAFVGALFKRPCWSGWSSPSAGSRPSWRSRAISSSSPSPTTCRPWCPHAMPADGVVSLIQGLFRETPGLGLPAVAGFFAISLVFRVACGRTAVVRGA